MPRTTPAGAAEDLAASGRVAVTTIGYAELGRLLDQGAQLVEVLPVEEYAEMHLPGADNISLKTLDAATTADLDRAYPVVVYCWDGLLRHEPTSRVPARNPSGSARSTTTGLARSTGSPAACSSRAPPPAPPAHWGGICATRSSPPRPTRPIADVRARVAASPHSFALVTTADRVLFGRLRGSHLDHATAAAVTAEVMEAGPSTLRPHVPVDAVRVRLVDMGLTYAIVTDPDGRLLGAVDPDDLM